MAEPIAVSGNPLPPAQIDLHLLGLHLIVGPETMCWGVFLTFTITSLLTSSYRSKYRRTRQSAPTLSTTVDQPYQSQERS